MFWTILFLAFGFILLVKSADLLVDGTAGLAKHFRIPKIIIGLTLVAFGTSAPEGTVSLIAALQNNNDLSIANIIGSNITNIGLILGLAALVRALPVMRSTVTAALPLCILSALVLIILGYDEFFQNQSTSVNHFTLGDGLIFLSLFVVFLYYIYADLKVAKIQEEEIEKNEISRLKSPLYLFLLSIAGLGGLLIGGKFVVDNSIAIARFFNLSEAIIGLTIVAIGTSLPEISTSLIAAIKRETDIAIGNIVGSNIFNILLVLGVTSVITPTTFNVKLLFDAVIMVFLTILLFLITLKEKSIPRWGGAILLTSYLIYVILISYKDITTTIL